MKNVCDSSILCYFFLGAGYQLGTFGQSELSFLSIIALGFRKLYVGSRPDHPNWYPIPYSETTLADLRNRVSIIMVRTGASKKYTEAKGYT